MEVDPAELANQRVSNRFLVKELGKEETRLQEAQTRLEKAQETIDTLSYVIPPLKEHAEMLKQEVKDVEMNTMSLVDAKKAADFENAELRKMLKSELDAYAKMRAVLLREEIQRLGNSADPSIVKLAVSSDALQSRIVALKKDVAKPKKDRKNFGAPNLPDEQITNLAKGRAFAPPKPKAKPKKSGKADK